MTTSSSTPRIIQVISAIDALSHILPTTPAKLARVMVSSIGESRGTWRTWRSASSDDKGGDWSQSMSQWAKLAGWRNPRSARRGQCILLSLGLLERHAQPWNVNRHGVLPDRFVTLAELAEQGEYDTLDAIVAEAELAERQRADRAATKLARFPTDRRLQQEAAPSGQLLRQLSLMRERIAYWGGRVLAQATPATPAPRADDVPTISGDPAVPGWVHGMLAEKKIRLEHADAWSRIQVTLRLLDPTTDPAHQYTVGRALIARIATRAGHGATAELQADTIDLLHDQFGTITQAAMCPVLPPGYKRMRRRLADGDGAAAVLRARDFDLLARRGETALSPISAEGRQRLRDAYVQLVTQGGDDFRQAERQRSAWHGLNG